MADMNDTEQNANTGVLDAPIPTAPVDRASPPDELPPEPTASDFGGDNGGGGEATNGRDGGDGEQLREDANNTTQGAIPGLKPGWLRAAAEEVAKKAARDDDGETAPARGADGKFLPKEGAAKSEAGEAKGEAGSKSALDAAAANAVASGTPPSDDAIKALEADLKGAKLNGREKKRYEKWLDTMKAEREQLTSAKKQAEEWQRKATEAEQKAASRPAITPEVEQELAALRDRSRRFDITTDPKFIKEYNAPVIANEDKIASLLEQIGREDKVRMPDEKIKELVSEYRRDGLTFETLGHIIATLQSDGKHGRAAQLSALIGRGDELRGARQSALDEHAAAIQSDAAKYAEMQQQQAEQQKKFGEKASAAINESLTANESALKKLFPSLLAPEPPSANDNPATTAAKNAARAEYDAAMKAARTEFSRYAADPNDAEKTAKLTGEFNSLAILGLLAKNHIMPKLAAQLAEKDKLIAARDEKLASFRKAGAVHQQRVASSGDAPDAGQQRAIPRDSDGKPKPGWLREMVVGR